MKIRHVGYSVSRTGGKHLHVDGGLDIKPRGVPTFSMEVGDTLFHVYLSSKTNLSQTEQEQVIETTRDHVRRRPEDF